MADRTGASLGFVLAGIAAATALGPWPTETPRLLALGAAAVASLGFLSGRYGLLDRRLVAPAAALGAAGIVAGGFAGFAAEGDVLLPGLAAISGVLAGAAAWADWRAIPRERLLRQARRATIGAVVGLAGIVSIVVWGGLFATIASATAAESLSTVQETILSTIALGAGTVTVAAAYLTWSGLDRSYVDARIPTRREWGYVVVGTILLLASNLAISALFGWLGVESTTHSLVRAARDAPEILLVLVPLSYLVVGPGEELLYRNVVQKSLREEFSGVGAVTVASVVFAAVHLPAYADPEGSALALLNTLAVVFVLSLILGAVYERTGNLTVSALVHGSFNAVAFAVTYAEITGRLG
jgi:membrane protease YdiL (CAAX protease family)